MKMGIQELPEQREKYHYTESGLDYVFLVNGFKFIENASGKHVKITDIEGLHQAIGRFIVDRQPALGGKELRFLRHEMLMSQKTMADVLRTSEQAVRRWENGKSAIPKLTDSVVRFLYKEFIRADDDENKPQKLKSALKEIARLEDEADRQMIEPKFDPTNDRWAA